MEAEDCTNVWYMALGRFLCLVATTSLGTLLHFNAKTNSSHAELGTTVSATGLDSTTTATTLSSDAEEDNTTSGDELKSSAVELTVGSRLRVETGDQPQDWFDPADSSNVQRSSSFTQARLFTLTTSFRCDDSKVGLFFSATVAADPLEPTRPRRHSLTSVGERAAKMKRKNQSRSMDKANLKEVDYVKKEASRSAWGKVRVFERLYSYDPEINDLTWATEPSEKPVHLR